MLFHLPIRRRRHFSLIELLVVIAIIAVILAIALPAISAVRRAAAKARSMANLHQLGIALADYDAQVGKLPPCATPRWVPNGFGNPPYQNTTTASPNSPKGNAALGNGPLPSSYELVNGVPSNGANDGGLFFYLLPYIEREADYERARQTSSFATGWSQKMSHQPAGWTSWGSGWTGVSTNQVFTSYTTYRAELLTGDVKIYEGPSDPTYQSNAGYVSYLANANLFDTPLGNPSPVVDKNNPNQAVSGWSLGLSSGGGQAAAYKAYVNYTIGNIPDGASQTIALAEGFASAYAYMDSYSQKENWAGPSWSEKYSSKSLSRICKYNVGAPNFASNSGKWTSGNNYSSYSYATIGPTFQFVPGKSFQVQPNPNGPWSNSNYVNSWQWSVGGGSWSSATYTASGTSMSPIDPRLPQGNFPGGCIVAMADGSVRFVRQAVSTVSWGYAVLPGDGKGPQDF